MAEDTEPASDDVEYNLPQTSYEASGKGYMGLMKSFVPSVFTPAAERPNASNSPDQDDSLWELLSKANLKLSALERQQGEMLLLLAEVRYAWTGCSHRLAPQC